VGAERHVLAVTLELDLDLVVPGCGRCQRDGPALPRRDADLLVHGVAGLIEQEGSGEISARRADGPVEGDLETARVLLAQRDALDHRAPERTAWDDVQAPVIERIALSEE